MIQNPFEVIEQRLSGIENLLIQIKHTPPPTIEQNDRCGLPEACEITGFSKSKMYKLSMSGDVPCKKFGPRLVFSRKELMAWMDARTVSIKQTSDVMAGQLAQVARKKR